MKILARYFFAFICIISLGIIGNEHKKLEEGFLKGTLVKTIAGYKPIESIKVDDQVIGADSKGNTYSCFVQAVHRSKAKKYLRLLIDKQIVEAGLKQQFLNENSQWVTAQQLKKDKSGLNGLSDVESVKKKAHLYALTVSGHRLLVTPKDILVHNASVAVAQRAAQIYLGSLTLLSPIQKIDVYASFDQFKHQIAQRVPALAYIEQVVKEPLAKKESAHNLINQSKVYRDIKAELLNTHKSFVNLISNIKQLSDSFTSFNKQLACEILHNIDNLVLLNNLSIEQEIALSHAELLELHNARYDELIHIKEEIEQLHLSIGIYFNTLLEKLELVNSEQQKVFLQTSSLIEQCNNIGSLNKAVECYQSLVKFEKLSEELGYMLKDVKVLLHYYHNLPYVNVFKEAVYFETKFPNDEFFQNIEKSLIQNVSIIAFNKKFFERQLHSCNINSSLLSQNGVEAIILEKNKRQQQSLKKALEQKSNSKFPKDPKKDDKKEDKVLHPHGKYEDASYHHKNSSGQKSPAPKDGQKALDNSIQIKPSSPHRIGISLNEIVYLSKTLEGLYHGHVRTWDELTSLMKNALIEAGLVTSKGKIL